MNVATLMFVLITLSQKAFLGLLGRLDKQSFLSTVVRVSVNVEKSLLRAFEKLAGLAFCYSLHSGQVGNNNLVKLVVWGIASLTWAKNNH